MLELYLVVRFALPLVLGAGVAWLAARVINARLARMPDRQIPLPAQSLLDSPAAQRRYQRLLRRRPGLRSLRLPAQAPRSWVWLTTLAVIAAVGTGAALTPNGARFQVMVESTLGYPATVVAVQVPEAQQDALLRAWAPVLLQTMRPVTLRYRVGRTRTPREVHDVLPVKLRRQGPVLQIATARPIDEAELRAALQARAPSSAPVFTVFARTVAPWREAGWRTMAPPAPP